ncbi:MAG: anhydro-N-acetylmuramic acid kinase, partial [Coxiella sp. (in: Bacteria)]
ANVTLIRPEHDVIGYDTGPGNTLLDAWCFQHSGARYDENGTWAKNGTIHEGLLKILLADPFFTKAPPKSTGLEYFNLKWVMNAIRQLGEHIPSQDIQTTLVELTATTIANTLNQHPAKHIWIAGGGAKNRYLMERLQQKCSINILSTDVVGIPLDWIEASAFAWFAYQTQHHLPSNIPSVTGAREAAVLGAVYY